MPGVCGAFAAKKHHQHEPEHIEGGEKRDDYAQDKQGNVIFLQRERQNAVLAVKAAERNHSAQGQRSRHERPEGHRQFFAQRAHFPDVLLVMHGEDDRSRAEEEQRLEKRVRGQMIHRRRRPAQAHGHDHVTQLRERRIGEDALDVVLLHRNQRRQERSESANPCDDRQCAARFDDEENTAQHVNTGRYHRRGMD